MDRAHRLLEQGYFPEQLPPPFNSRDLARDYATLHSLWCAIKKKSCRAGPSGLPIAPPSKPEIFSVARAGWHRRVLSIPNPVAQTFIAICVKEYWAELVRHYRQSHLGVSRPRFLRKGLRAATIPPMQPLYEKRLLRSTGYRFMLRTDVSRFFPTIYTHSIPWALHSKATSKSHRALMPAYFGNLIDLSIRQGQDGQTIGVPIGPDTSRIIAEAVATSVDLELKKRLGAWPAGFRYVDDYFLFFPSLAEAESALAALTRSLKEFELQVNFEKTKIATIREITEDFWTHQIRNFSIGKDGRKQVSDLHHFFDTAKKLANEQGNESVLTYALQRLRKVFVRPDSWLGVEAHLCQIALSYPNTLQTVARFFSTYAHIGYPLNKDRLSRTLNAIVEDHAPLGHHGEVAWALWMCKDLDVELYESNAGRVCEMHSSVCALLLLDLHDLGKLTKAPKATGWRALRAAEELHGDLWLLVYEAGIRGWGSFNDRHIRKDPHFEELRLRDIHFYDQTSTLEPFFTVRQGAQPPDPRNHLSLFLSDRVEDFIEYAEDEADYDGVVVADVEDEAADETDAGNDGPYG